MTILRNSKSHITITCIYYFSGVFNYIVHTYAFSSIHTVSLCMYVCMYYLLTVEIYKVTYNKRNAVCKSTLNNPAPLRFHITLDRFPLREKSTLAGKVCHCSQALWELFHSFLSHYQGGRWRARQLALIKGVVFSSCNRTLKHMIRVYSMCNPHNTPAT